MTYKGFGEQWAFDAICAVADKTVVFFAEKFACRTACSHPMTFSLIWSRLLLQFYEEGILIGPSTSTTVAVPAAAAAASTPSSSPSAVTTTTPSSVDVLLPMSGHRLTQYNGPPCPAYHNPCLNSRCLPDLNDFECDCPMHYTGKRCEIREWHLSARHRAPVTRRCVGVMLTWQSACRVCCFVLLQAIDSQLIERLSKISLWRCSCSSSSWT